jgi:hypothetical protein
MRALVVESDPGAAVVAAAQLEAAGHEVLRCHEAGERAFPCVGLETGHCPLEHDEIDVVLTVRSRAIAHPAPLEDGAVCALRRHVPLVVAGRTTANPFGRYPVTVAGVDVVAACERAATGPLLEHEAVALRALDETLDHAGIDTGASAASVHRRQGRLIVALTFPPDTPAKLRAMAGVRVTGALRRFDPYASGIDVVSEEPESP